MKLTRPNTVRPVVAGVSKATSMLLAVIAWPSLTSGADLGVIEIVGSTAQEAAVPFQIGDTPEGEFTGFREVIDKEELQQAGGSLAEVIATESGAQFKQTGGLGSFTTVSIRGSSAEQVNVYLDGILLNEAGGGGVNLSHIELMQADRVEVYRGSVPVQLGNSAIGGAINIITTRATDKPLARMMTGFGSFGSSRIATSFAGPLGWFNDQRVVASFSHRQSDNDFSFLNDNGTIYDPDDDKEQKRKNAQTESTSGFLKSGHRLSGGGWLEHVLQLSQHRQGISDWQNSDQGTARFNTHGIQWRSSLSKVAQQGKWSSKWDAHYSTQTEIYDDSDNTIGNGGQRINAGITTFGGSGFFEKLLDNQSWSLNLKARSEALDSNNELQISNATRAERHRIDAIMQWNRFFNDGGSLFSSSLSAFSLNDDYRIESAADARDDYSLTAVTSQLGVSHVLSESFGGHWSLTANAALQQRPPSFFELFGEQGLFQGNSGLQAEASRNLDVGVLWQSDASKEIDKQVQLVLFQSRKDDLIAASYNARGIGRSENISRARVIGLEASGSLLFKNNVSLAVNVTVQDAENQSDISGFTGMQLPGESSIDGAYTARWKNDRWKAEYEFSFNSNRFYDSPNYLPAVDQRIHHVRLSRYWKHWRLDLELNNLTDQNYEDFNGYPKPGRTGFVSVTFQP